MKKEISILGAGLVGSLLALMLRKRGYTVKVYERRGDIRNATLYAGRSINLAMSTRGWRALELAGLKKELEQIAIPMYGREIHDKHGSIIFQEYGSAQQAIYSVSRGELNKTLLQAAEDAGAAFFFNHKCVAVSLDENLMTFDVAGNELKVQSEFIIGADGAFSALRKEYTLLDRSDYQQSYIEHGYKEFHIPATNAMGAFAMKKEALHIWPRKNFMLIALPNIDGSFTCTLFFPFEGLTSFDSVTTDEDIKALFTEHFPDAIPLMPSYVDDYHSNPTSSLITVRTNPWIYKTNSLIIGDAAHAIVPFYGQGMNSGFEDCYYLNHLLEKYSDNWPTVLTEYQKMRKPNGDAVAQLALNNFVEMRDLVADPLFLERKKIEKELMLRYPQQYKSVYEMVSFSHTPYAFALGTLQAQDELYKSIINEGDFFANIANPDFSRMLDQLVEDYSQKISTLDIYG
jgi:kynurenine 3-monooxygenase